MCSSSRILLNWDYCLSSVSPRMLLMYQLFILSLLPDRLFHEAEQPLQFIMPWSILWLCPEPNLLTLPLWLLHLLPKRILHKLQPPTWQKTAQLFLIQMHSPWRLLRQQPNSQFPMHTGLLSLLLSLHLQRMQYQLLPQEWLNVLSILPQWIIYQHPTKKMRTLPLGLF